MIGQQVGNYKVISLLGAGGMGEVFLAEHVTIGTRVAIKVLQSQISKDQDQVNRFFNEAKAVSKVRHAGPVKIFDCGFHVDPTNQRVAYLAMEFLEGESLAARIKRLGTLPGEQVAEIGRQIAGVLDAVHTAGITHRDLKPDNIFLVPDHELPSGERVKVLDFGIAKLTGTMAGAQTKGTMGTPAYMAPEQWNNSSAVDGRADCYSLGCVMYEMAVGRPPFPSQSIGEACNHHLNTPPPRASQAMHAIPHEFDTLVDRMLSKTVDQRPTIKEVARAFDTLRTSGATQRWHAAAVSGIQATVVPETLLGSRPDLAHLGSQPSISAQYGSQPGPISGQYGSQPAIAGYQQGMQNPLLTPQPSAPYPAQTPQHAAAQYPAQVGPSASYPAQPTPHHATPQHHTSQHATPPQHHTPPPQQFTPQHLSAAPAKSNKGLVLALGAVVLVGGGVAAVAIATSGDKSGTTARGDSGGDKPIGDKPVGGVATGGDKPIGGGATAGDKPIGGDQPGRGSTGGDKPGDKPGVGGLGTVGPSPDKGIASKRDQILAKNAFVDRGGVRVLSSQITAAEYELVLGKLPDGVARSADAEAPVASLTQQEAVAFCAAIDAHLPTSDEWEKAAKGAWGIAVDAVAGPLQEWTSTIKDELVVVRGGHAAMAQAQLDKSARSNPPYFLQKEPAGTTFDRKIVSSPTIGFRCVDGKASAAAEVAPPAVGLITDENRKILDKVIDKKLIEGTIGKFDPAGLNRPGPSVKNGGTSTGSLRPDAIQIVIKARIGVIKTCYTRELAKRPGLAGKITVSFTILPNGDVSNSRGSGFDPVVATCVAGVVAKLKFTVPSGSGNVNVNYPFIFSPE